MNQLPGDGLNIVGINLPHIVFQPIEGQVQYKTDDVTPAFWFHYTPDALVVLESSPLKIVRGVRQGGEGARRARSRSAARASTPPTMPRTSA